MTQIEIQTQEILSKLQILDKNPTRDIEDLYAEILSARKIHRMKRSDSSRRYLRRALRLFLHLYADIPDPRVLKIAFYYLKMFDDERSYLSWIRRHRVGADSREFYTHLALHYEQRGRHQQVLETAAVALAKNLASAELLDCKRRAYQALHQSITASADGSSVRSSREAKTQPADLFFESQFEEMRLFSLHKARYFAELGHGSINPYLAMGTSKFAVSVMVDFLSPDRLFSVYYYHGSTISLTSPLPLPRLYAQRVSYTEWTSARIPPAGELYIHHGVTNYENNEKARNNPDINKNAQDLYSAGSRPDLADSAYNTAIPLFLAKALGAGGFGRVVSARCCGKQVAFKHFTRDKDCLEYANAASASFVREAYAFAFLSANGVKTLRFIAAVVGPSGAGIVMEKSSGLSLYDIMRDNMKFARLNTPCFEEEQIRDYFLQMTYIIANIFALNFLHADCKIDNWMLHGGEVILIDFGKAVNLKLFAQYQQPLRFSQNSLNPVSPSPSCVPTWCFEADLCGLAACLFGLIYGRILSKDDIYSASGSIDVKCAKYLKRGALFVSIMKKLLFTRCDAGTYAEQQAKALALLDEVQQMLLAG